MIFTRSEKALMKMTNNSDRYNTSCNREETFEKCLQRLRHLFAIIYVYETKNQIDSLWNIYLPLNEKTIFHLNKEIEFNKDLIFEIRKGKPDFLDKLIAKLIIVRSLIVNGSDNLYKQKWTSTKIDMDIEITLYYFSDYGAHVD